MIKPCEILNDQLNTVGINLTISDPFTPRISKLGGRYFEANKIDSITLQIRTNRQKGTGTKMAEKLNNLTEKKSDFSPVLNPTQTTP